MHGTNGVSTETGPPIVGIGASAGGLEAVKDMLANVPADCGLAFVLVQHLDPNHTSMLAELIGRSTALKVCQLEDGQKVEAGALYVIPPGHELRLEGGVLHLEPFAEPRGLRRPIDSFLMSLAQDQSESAAAVILSGTGADGALGLRAIKEAGGVVAAQLPEDARYDGMPRAALATGLVDFIAPADEISDRLLTYFRRRDRLANHTTITEEIGHRADEICAALRQQIGHDFSGYKRTTLVRRIYRRMQVLALSDPRDYLIRLRQDAEECEALFRDLLIHVTQFFRDPEYFEVLREQAIRPLVERTDRYGTLRVWVPGCSTGEEAYTIAMILDRECREQDKHPRLHVFATDIDERSLAVGREARYPLNVLRDIPEAYRDECTIGVDTQFMIAPRIRDIVRFSRHSLIKDPPFSKVDLISCRNLLIYLGDQVQSTVLPLLQYALNPEGYLFLGPSESTGRQEGLFTPVDRTARLFQRGKGRSAYPLSMPITPASQGEGRPRLPDIRPPREEAAPAHHQRIMSLYAPPHVVVDRDGQILSQSARLSRYLDPPAGEPTTQVLSLARRGLREVLSPMLRQAVSTDKRAAREKVEVRSEFGVQRCTVIVDPLPDNTYLIVFLAQDDFEAEIGNDLAILREDDATYALEEELRETRQRLRTTVEELETANEELKSSNEEMMSMNEELQSANEELSTVNEELKNKVDELAVANDDMKNFIASTELALIVLDAKHRLRNFTPPARELFALDEESLGLPSSNIARRFDCPDFEDLVSTVLRENASQERLVMSHDGRRFTMRVLPYRTEENTLEGVTVTLNDITSLTRLEEDVKAQSDRLSLAMMVNGLGVWELDMATGEMQLDRAVQRLFGLQNRPEALLEEILENVAAPDPSEVQQDMREALREGAHYEGVLQLDLGGEQGRRWVKLIAHNTGGATAERMLGVALDVSREESARAMNALLLREMNHRVKNLFAVIMGMLSLAAREHDDVQAMVADLRRRVETLARAHALSQGSNTDGVALEDFVREVLRPYCAGDQLSLEGKPVRLPPKMITPMGLILHEWATNSMKYGALREGDGRLTVTWERDSEGNLAFAWNETVSSAFAPSNMDSGFGTHLVSASARQLDATIDTRMEETGFEGRITIAGFDREGGQFV